MTSGCGESWQLGNGKAVNNQKEFQKVKFFENMKVKQVDCDDRYTVVLTEEGEVYHMGLVKTGWVLNEYQ